MWWGNQEPQESPSAPPTNSTELQEQLQQQQQLIDQLKNMMRQSEQSLEDKEKELKANASKLTKIKLQHKAKVTQLTSQLQDVQKKGVLNAGNLLPTSEVAVKNEEDDDASSGGSHASHSEQSNRGRVLLLKKKLEESRAVFEKQEQESKQRKNEIEDLVGQLRSQLHERDQTIQHLEKQLDSSPPTEIPPTSDTNKDDTKINEMYAQIVYKDSKILELNNRILELEGKVMDFQENIKEKDEVIQSRNKAIQLMMEDMSRRGKNTVDQLDDTRDEMRLMQQSFVAQEAAWKEEQQKLNTALKSWEEKHELEVSEKETKISEMKEAIQKSEATRFELAARNAALQEKVVLLQESVEKFKNEKPNSDNEGLLREISELKSILDEKEKTMQELLKSAEGGGNQTGSGKVAVKLKARIKSLEKQLSEKESRKSSKGATLELEQKFSESEKEKGKLHERIQELQEKLNQQSDDLSNHVRMVTLLQSEKMDLAEALAKVKRDSVDSSMEESSTLEAKVSLEKKVLELEDAKETLFKEIETLKQRLENEQQHDNNFENATLQSKLSETTAELQLQLSRLEQLQSDLTHVKEENRDLEEQLQQFRSDMEASSQEQKSASAKQQKIKNLLSGFCELHSLPEPTVEAVNSKWNEILEKQQRTEEQVSEFCAARGAKSLEELETEWELLKQSEKGYCNRVEKQSEELSVLRDELDNMQKRFEAFQTSSKAEKENLNSVIKELGSEKELLNNKLQETREEMSSIKEAAERHRGLVSDLQAELDKLTKEREILESNLNESSFEIQNYTIALNENEKRLAEVSTELAASKKNADVLKKKLSKLEGKLAKQTQHMSQAGDSFSEQLSEMELEVNRLQKCVSEKEEKEACLQEECGHLKASAESLFRELSANKEELSFLMVEKDKDIVRLQQQNQDIQELRQTLSERENEFEDEMNARTEEFERLKGDLKDLYEKQMRQEQEFKSTYEGKEDALLQAREELTKSKAEHEMAMKEKDILVERLKADIAKYEENVAKLSASVESLQKKIDNKSSEIENINQAKQQLESEVGQKVRETVALQTKLEELEATSRFHKNQLDMKDKDSSEQVQDLENERLRLQELVEEKNGFVEQVQAQLSSAQKAYSDLEKETNDKINQLQDEARKMTEATDLWMSETKKQSEDDRNHLLSKITELENAVLIATNEKSEQEVKIEEYKNKIQELEIESKSSQENSVVLEASVTELQKQLTIVNGNMNTNLLSLQEVSRQSSEAQAKVSKLEKQLESSKKKFSAITEVLQRCKEEIASLQHDCISNAEELSSEKQRVVTLEQDLLKMTETKEQVAGKVDKLEIFVKNITSDRQQTLETSRQLEEQLSMVTQEYESLKVTSSQQIYELHSSLKKQEELLRTSSDTKEDEVKRLRKENMKFQEYSAEAAKELENLQLQLVEKGRLLSHLENECEKVNDLQEKLLTIQKENSELEARTAEQNEKLTTYIQQLEEDLKATSEMLDTLKEEKGVLETTLMNANSCLENAQSANVRLGSELSNVTNELEAFKDNHQTRLFAKDEEIKILHVRLRELEKSSTTETLLADHKTETDELNVKVSNLLEENENLQEKIHLLENDVVASKSSSEEKDELVQNLRRSLEEFELKFSDLRSGKDSMIEQLQNQLQERVLNFESEVQAKNALLGELQREIQAKSNESDDLNKNVNEQAAFFNNIQEEKQKEIEMLQNDITTYSQNITRMQTTIDTLMESERGKDVERSQLVNQLEQMNMVLTQEQSERRQVVSHLQQIESQLAQEQSEHQETKMNLRKLMHENEACVSSADELRTLNSSLAEQVTNLTQNKTELESLLKKNEQQITTLTEEKSLLTDHLEQLKREVDDLNSKLAMSRNETTEVVMKLDSLERHLENLSSEKNSVDQELVNVKQDYADHQERSKEVCVQMRGMAEDLMRTVLGDAAVEFTVQAAKQQVLDNRCKIDELTGELNESNAKNFLMERELEELQKTLFAPRVHSSTEENNSVNDFDKDAVDSLSKILSAVDYTNDMQEQCKSVPTNDAQEQIEILRDTNLKLNDEVSDLKNKIEILLQEKETCVPEKVDLLGELQNILRLIGGGQEVTFEEAKAILEKNVPQVEEIAVKSVDTQLESPNHEVKTSSPAEKSGIEVGLEELASQRKPSRSKAKASTKKQRKSESSRASKLAADADQTSVSEDVVTIETLKELFELICPGSDSSTLSIADAKRVVQETDAKIKELQRELDSLRNKQQIKTAPSSSQMWEIEGDIITDTLAGEWATSDNLMPEVIGDDTIKVSVNRAEYDALVKENFSLKDQMAELQTRLGEMVNRIETSSASQATLLGGSRGDSNREVIGLILGREVAGDVDMEEVKRILLQRSEERDNFSALLIEADVKNANLQTELEAVKEKIDNLLRENKILSEKLKSTSSPMKEDDLRDLEKAIILTTEVDSVFSTKNESDIADGEVENYELNRLTLENQRLRTECEQLKEELSKLINRFDFSSEEKAILLGKFSLSKKQEVVEELISPTAGYSLQSSSSCEPDEINNLLEDNKKLKDEVSNLKAEEETLTSRLLEINTTLRNLSSEKETLTTLVSQLQEENENLQRQINVESSKTENVTQKVEAGKLDQELITLKVKNGKMLAKLKQFKDKNDNLHEELKSCQTSLQTSEDEKSLLQTEISRLHDRLDTVEVANSNLIETKECLEGRIVDLECHNRECREEMEKLQSDKERFDREINVVNEQNEALSSDNSTFQVVVEKLKSSKSHLESELKTQMTAIFHAGEEKQKLMKEMKDLEDSLVRLRNLENEYNVERDKWLTVESAFEESQKNVVELQASVEQLRRENEILRKDKIELEFKCEDVHKYTEQVDALSEKLRVTEMENRELNSRVEMLQSDFALLQTKIKGLQTEKTQLQERLTVSVFEKTTSPPETLRVEESRQMSSPPTDEVKCLQTKVDLLEKERVELCRAVEHLTLSLEEMKTRNVSEKDSLLQKLEGWRSQSEKLNAENLELAKRHQRLEETVESLALEKQSLLEQVHQRKGEMDQLQWQGQRQAEEIAALKATVEKQYYEIKGYTEDNARLRSDLNEVTSDNVNLEAERSSLQQEVDNLKTSNDSLGQQLENWKKHLNSVSSNFGLPDSNKKDSLSSSSHGSNEFAGDKSVVELKADLSHTMQALHHRDRRCEELIEEVTSLIEDRDSLQLRLSTLMKTQYRKDTEIQQLHQQLQEQKHSPDSQSVHSMPFDEKSDVDLEAQQPLMMPEKSYTLTRTMATRTWRIQNWLQGRQKYLQRMVSTRPSLKLLYYAYIMCLHVILLVCAFGN